MPSNKEALSSSDPSVVKAARSNVKGLVTRKINEIEKNLVHEEVDESQQVLLDKKVVELKEREELFHELNDRLLDLLAGEDLTEEEEFCDEVDASIASCEVKIKKRESAQQAKDLERRYLKEYNAYKREKMSVESIRAKYDNPDKKEFLDKEGAWKKDLVALKRFSTIFETTAAVAQSLLEKLEQSGLKKEKIDARIEFDYKAEFQNNLDIGLTASLIEREESEGKSSISKSTGAAAALKLAKPETPKWSGKAKDWSKFVRDFRELVVPNREDSNIGISGIHIMIH